MQDFLYWHTTTRDSGKSSEADDSTVVKDKVWPQHTDLQYCSSRCCSQWRVSQRDDYSFFESPSAAIGSMRKYNCHRWWCALTKFFPSSRLSNTEITFPSQHRSLRAHANRVATEIIISLPCFRRLHPGEDHPSRHWQSSRSETSRGTARLGLTIMLSVWRRVVEVCIVDVWNDFEHVM